MRLQTAPTGPGGNIELPNYLFKLHETAPTGLGVQNLRKNGKLNSPVSVDTDNHAILTYVYYHFELS